MNRRFGIWCVLTLLFLPSGMLTAQKRLKFSTDGQFRIVQITDMHIDLKKGMSEGGFELIEEAIRAEKPDLIVFTGDQVTESTTGSLEALY